MPDPITPIRPPEADPEWFRAPRRRERWIAASLFIAFGLFFISLCLIYRDWWFRWVILGLGVISIFNGVRHGVGARDADSGDDAEPTQQCKSE